MAVIGAGPAGMATALSVAQAGHEVALFERMLLSCSPHVRAACGAAMSDMDLHHAVVRIDVPTLVVAGTEDTFTPYWLSEEMHDRIPRSELLTVPGGNPSINTDVGEYVVKL